jgi:hypothetical protein
MTQHTWGIELTPDQEAEAAVIEARLLDAAREDIRWMARLLASKEDGRLFGETEFQLRDVVHRVGAKALEITADERSKKGVLR